MRSMLDMACNVISFEREPLKGLQHGFKCGEVNIQRTPRGTGRSCIITGAEDAIDRMIEEASKFEGFKGEQL